VPLHPDSRAYDPRHRPSKTLEQVAAESPGLQFLSDRLAQQQAGRATEEQRAASAPKGKDGARVGKPSAEERAAFDRIIKEETGETPAERWRRESMEAALERDRRKNSVHFTVQRTIAAVRELIEQMRAPVTRTATVTLPSGGTLRMTMHERRGYLTKP
jgi:hypothetical protein